MDINTFLKKLVLKNDTDVSKRTKSEIIDFAKRIKVPLQLTFSTNPNDMPKEYQKENY